MNLGRVCVRVTIEAPIDIVGIDVMERIHPQFAPLDIEPSALGIGEPIAETDLQFRGSDDVVVRRFVDERFEVEPEVTNPLECRKIDRPELAGAVVRRSYSELVAGLVVRECCLRDGEILSRRRHAVRSSQPFVSPASSCWASSSGDTTSYRSS
jgi:hypothetical protein